MTVRILIDSIGWIGMACIVIAYGLVSSQKVKGNSRSYQVINLSGSLFLLINSYYHGAFPSVGLNVIWMGIAVTSLWNIWRHSKPQSQLKKDPS
jgi:hypothetical protein